MGVQSMKKFAFFDTLVNFISKIGVTGDKSIGNTYALAGMDKGEIDAAYRTSWLAKKVINIPPLDMTREWRLWQAEKDQIEDLENFEKEHGIIKKTRKALTWGRLYGGGALVLGVDQGERTDEPLVIERVKKGGLKFVHVVHRHQITAQEIDRDPMSPTYEQPKVYQVSGAQTGSINVHPSRVIRFLGNEYPDDEVNEGWSDPYWMSLREIISQSDALSAVISALVQEAKVDIIHIPNFMENVGTEEYESLLLKRFTLAMTMKSVTNTTILDGGADGKSGEQWDRKEINFSGLTDILRLFLAVSAGAADIPATRLLGKSPDGMNATGDSDLRNYYDMISSRQELEMWPQLQTFDKLMMQSLWGKMDESIVFEPAPLWQMTPQEKADIAAKKAATTKVYADSGLIPELTLAKSVQNQLIEDQIYPGFEDALEELGSEPDEEEPPTLLLPAPPGALPAPSPGNRAPATVGRAEPTDRRMQDSVATRKLDPTNTGTIRKAWKMAVTGALRKAETRIRNVIKASEGVGIDQSIYRDLLAQHLGGEWFNKYIVRAYRRGLDDAGQRLGISRLPFGEGDIQSIRDILGIVKQDFSNIAEDLSKELHDRVRATTSVDEAINVLGERMKSIGVVRGHTVVAVRTVGTHARASLNHYKSNGVTHVGLDVEGVTSRHVHDEDLLQFATAGDDNVCPECEDLEGQIFEVDEAQGVIPVHPNCRCAWIPVRDPEGRFNPRIRANDALTARVRMIGRVGDASPRSLYISRKVLNAGAIIAWAKAQGFKDIETAEEMHVTICYSRTPVDWMKVGESWDSNENGEMTIRPGGARIVERLGPTATVLLFNSSALSWRHESIIHAGASHDYGDYQPHITITYSDPPPLNEVEPYKGEIVLGPEIFAEINGGT